MREWQWKDFGRGAGCALPVLLGFAPCGLALGAWCVQKGFSALGVPLFCGANFAGGSEFAVVAMWTWPPNVLLAVMATLLVNSRHLLMGAVLGRFMEGLPAGKALPALFLMCDETWALSLADATSRDAGGRPRGWSFAHYLGTGITLWCGWVVSTLTGALAGPLIGVFRVWGLDMAFPAIILFLVKGMWRGIVPSLPWLASLIAAVLACRCLPQGWYVPCGALAGLACALLLPAGSSGDGGASGGPAASPAGSLAKAPAHAPAHSAQAREGA